MTQRIGIDLGGTKIEGVVTSRGGEILRRERIATPRDYPDIVRAVAELVAALWKTAPDAAVGIGAPGAVNAAGLTYNSNTVCFNGRPLRADIAAALDRPVRMVNDANCLALSEATDGAAAGAEVVFGVILGTGVGGGIVVDGRLLNGPNRIAGEWGHNPLPWPAQGEWPGPACYCGRSGCIETFLSGPGLTRDHQLSTGVLLEASQIVEAAAQGELCSLASVERYEQRLARALAHVIDLLDPDAIVLGGGLSNVARWYQSVPRLWRDWVFCDRVDTLLLRNRHGDSSGVRGAAWLG